VLTLQDAIEQIPLLKKSPTAAYQVNLACERLVAMGKFKGLLLPIHLRVYEQGTVTLPADFETMIGAVVEGTQVALHDPWYEFAPRPNFPFTPDPTYYSADLGDHHVVYRSPAGATRLRVQFSDAADADKEISIITRSSEDEGIEGGYTTVNNSLGGLASGFGQAPINEVVRITKPRTSGFVQLQAQLGGVWVEIGKYGPRDTDIRLRKYSVNMAHVDDIVTAYCKKRFRPVEDLSDELPVESIYCLRMAIEALLSETENNLEKAANFWAMARKGLSDALSEHRSSALRTVPVYCRAAAGANLRAIR
jgi:hypothetical protein